MNDEKDKDSIIEIEQAIHGQGIDWYLQKLVSLANENGLEIGITLIIGGSIVSGTIVSGKKYFETFAAEFSAAWPGDDKESIRESFASFASIYESADDKELQPPQYIHLTNARFHAAEGNLPTNGGVLWRGKINAVSGFNLGSLTSANA